MPYFCALSLVCVYFSRGLSRCLFEYQPNRLEAPLTFRSQLSCLYLIWLDGKGTFGLHWENGKWIVTSLRYVVFTYVDLATHEAGAGQF